MCGRTAYGSGMPFSDGYVLLGHGPAATGSAVGWNMRDDLFARCSRCGDLMSLDPTETRMCSCGSLSKDADAGRFGSALGDDSIAIYRRG